MSGTLLHPASPVPETLAGPLPMAIMSVLEGRHKAPVSTFPLWVAVPHIPDTPRAICAPPPWESLHTPTTLGTPMPPSCPRYP